LQCGGNKRFAFIVHGLWPQYAAGWPEFCLTPEDSVPEERIAEMLPVMPSPHLIVHQWRKHGSCSGLPMDDYFALMRSMLARVRIPARYLSPTAPIVTSPRQIVSDFVKSNRDLHPSMISVRCGRRKHQARLSEVRICFALDGGFISCGSNEHLGCKASSLLLPPARATGMTRTEGME
jgi:ribonuclease T2